MIGDRLQWPSITRKLPILKKYNKEIYKFLSKDNKEMCSTNSHQNEYGQCSLTLMDQTSPVVRYLTRTSHHVSGDNDLTGNGPVLTLNHK